MNDGDQEGVIKARDMVRKSRPSDRWNAEGFDNVVKHPPWSPNPRTNDDIVHIAVRVPPDEAPITKPPETSLDRKVRRFAIDPKEARERGMWESECIVCSMMREAKKPTRLSPILL